MTTPSSHHPTATPNGDSAPSAASTTPPAAAPAGPVPTLTTALSADEIVKRLDAACRRGRLPGFSAGGGGGGGRGGALFEVRDFGAPCEGVLRAHLDAGQLRFTTGVQKRLPAIMLVVLILTVWPGVWLTEGAIASFFPGSEFWKWTAWWYLPVTILSIPWVMHAMLKKSRASIMAEAHEIVGKIGKELSRP